MGKTRRYNFLCAAPNSLPERLEKVKLSEKRVRDRGSSQTEVLTSLQITSMID